MKKNSWRKFVAPLAALYVVIWVGFCGWAALQTNKGKEWTIEKHVDPHVSPFPHVSKEDWCAVLATADFSAKSLDRRLAVAEAAFQNVRSLADGDGYNLAALRKWFRDTATNFTRYPIREFVYQSGEKALYRDLRSSGFPKLQRSRLFWRYLFDQSSLIASLWLLPFLAAPLLLLAGAVLALLNKALAFRWKLLVAGLVGIGVVEALMIHHANKRAVQYLDSYNFYDSGDHVSATGTWTSQTKLAAPIQTSHIDCWREWNHCIHATASILMGGLNVDMTYWEAKDWGKDAIVLVDSQAVFGCTTTNMQINRKNKTVTMTKTRIEPKPDDCPGIPDDVYPIFTQLVDGSKVNP